MCRILWNVGKFHLPTKEVRNGPQFGSFWGQGSHFVLREIKLKHMKLNLTLQSLAGSFRTARFKLLKTKRNLLYIRNQSVPRSKHFPPRL